MPLNDIMFLQKLDYICDISMSIIIIALVNRQAILIRGLGLTPLHSFPDGRIMGQMRTLEEFYKIPSEFENVDQGNLQESSQTPADAQFKYFPI